MNCVSFQIVRHVDSAQPGWVEARLRDARGREWVFVEKAPILAVTSLGEDSSYPQPGMIACEVVKAWRGDDGREICTIDTANPDGVEAEDGITRFDVLAEQIIPC